ncbi:hypothetical protein BVX98_07230, partial [bacterium F11]
MVPSVQTKWKFVARSGIFLILLVLGVRFLLWAETSWDGEKLALEMTMQKRVEAVLSRIMVRGQFVVVVSRA